MTLKEQLISWNACKEAIDWVGDKELLFAWATCKRYDWMLWYAAKFFISNREVWMAYNEYANYMSRTPPVPIRFEDISDIVRMYITPDMFGTSSILDSKKVD